MNSEPARPSSTAIAPISARPLPGWWETWKVAHCLTPTNLMLPSPPGSFIVSPGCIIWATARPSCLYCLRFFFSSWYTLCGSPESTPRSPWYAVSVSRGLSSAGKVENIEPEPLPPYVGTKKPEKPSWLRLPSWVSALGTLTTPVEV